jgi:hypothetical protein
MLIEVLRSDKAPLNQPLIVKREVEEGIVVSSMQGEVLLKSGQDLWKKYVAG